MVQIDCYWVSQWTMCEWLSLSVCLAMFMFMSCTISASMCAWLWLSEPLSLMYSLRLRDSETALTQLPIFWFAQCIMQLYIFFHTASTQLSKTVFHAACWHVHQSIPTGHEGYFERGVGLKASPQGHTFHVGKCEHHAYMKVEERENIYCWLCTKQWSFQYRLYMMEKRWKKSLVWLWVFFIIP